MMLLATLPVNYRRRVNIAPPSDLEPGQYRTYFDEYAVGVQPSDWTLRWDASFPCTVEERNQTQRGRVLRMGEGTTGRNLLSWNVIDDDADRADVEILLHARFPGITQSQLQGNGEFLSLARGANSAANASGYRNGMRPRISTMQAELGRYDNGSFASFGPADPFNYAPDTFYWLRTRSEGTTHYLKQWAGTIEDEPVEWDITGTDSAVTAAGWVGIFRNSSCVVEMDYFSVGTGGQSAPPPSTDDITPLDTTGVSATSDFDSGDSV